MVLQGTRRQQGGLQANADVVPMLFVVIRYMIMICTERCYIGFQWRDETALQLCPLAHTEHTTCVRALWEEGCGDPPRSGALGPESHFCVNHQLLILNT